mgnify:CR=1 FL=1|jgi:5'(3')-deoxyribonucleotidase|tara:strand:+ start:6204 stop:6788 length:585 start_codon:yes stop_codon:yes gene_type:complete
MRIGITINGVLRDTLQKVILTYNRYNEADIKIEDLKSLNLLEYLKFETEEELLEWMYVECPMEIFGNGLALRDNIFNTLNTFYKDFRDEHEIIIVSEEIEKSKSATLFFLAKYGCLIDNIKFFGLNSFYDNVWEDVDMIITTDPQLISKKPKNKKSIKIEDRFNKEINSDFTISELEQIFDLNIFKNEEEEITE